MNMYSQHTPVPMAVPVPVPVPLVVSSQTKDLRDAAVQSELSSVMEEKQEDEPVSSADQSGSPHRDMKSEAVAVICEDEEREEAVQASVPPNVNSESADPTLADPTLDDPTESADPTLADPTESADPTLDDPTESADPTLADPTESADPTLDDPTADPTLADPTLADPTESADPTLADPTESADPTVADLSLNTQPEETSMRSDPPTSSAEHQPPSSPVMDLESDIPSETLDQKAAAPQRGVKRSRESHSSRKRSRRRTVLNRSAVVTPAVSKLNHLYGVKAWKSWVQQQNKQLTESSIVDIKEDVLQCDSAELSFALSRFIREVRRPNGETYSPDSIFYLCLGIQQYLFMKGRIENIFTDELYNQFATKISGMLQLWKPTPLPGGGAVSSRVVESYLWECKQLGAYSPIVLLNTLLFFCAKYFGFTTLAQHQSLSFTNFTRHSKPCNRAGKVHYLRYQGSSSSTPHTERFRKRQGEERVDLEMLENVANPLHCPVRLYEFYLSRCPESVKWRTDMFFLQPEQNVHTHSPYWYTSQPLEDSTLQSMLTRILAVREVHQQREAAQHQASTSADADTLQ